MRYCRSAASWLLHNLWCRHLPVMMTKRSQQRSSILMTHMFKVSTGTQFSLYVVSLLSVQYKSVQFFRTRSARNYKQVLSELKLNVVNANSVVKVGLKRWGTHSCPLSSLTVPLLPAFSSALSSPLLFPPPRSSRSQLGGLGSTVSSPSGVWGGAAAILTITQDL